MRKLASGALAFSAAVFAANYILPWPFLLPSALLLLLAGLGLLFLRRRWLLLAEIALICASLGLTAFHVHALRTDRAVEKLSGSKVEIEAYILDYPVVYSDYCRVELRLTGENTPRLKALLYDNDNSLACAEPGQRIALTAKLRPADTRYGEDYDYYYSKNIYCIASSVSPISLEAKVSSLAVFPAFIREYVKKAVTAVFPADTEHFMRSVLLGDKSDLYADVPNYLALSRAGFMHIAAVSGMHLAFFAGFIRTLFGSSRRSSLVCIGLLWLFVLVTGCTPSAVRAGFMQSVLLMAPVFKRENDPVTSLSAVLALVLLFNPYAAASVSLQLSFAAMAGILCFAERIQRGFSFLPEHGIIGSLLHYVSGIISTSLSVMIFTLPLMAIHFGSVSILAPISNALALWAVSLCFSGGVAAVGAYALVPAAGRLIGWLSAWTARYVLLVARVISSVDFAVVCLDNVFMWCWFALSLVMVLALCLHRIPIWAKLLWAIGVSAVLLVEANTLARFHYNSDSGTIAVLDVGQGQCIAALGGGGTVVVDCGGTGTLDNPGETAGTYLISRGVREIDALLLTHLHADHANGVLMLMELLPVKNLYLPANAPDDMGLLPPILAKAESYGAKVHYVWGDWKQSFGTVEMQMYEPSYAGDANEMCVMCTLSLDGYDMLITADAPMAAEDQLMARRDLSGTEAFVVGHHGSRYSTGAALLEELGARTAIISTGYNTYGHPTYETLERLALYGLEIYRTDLNGTVEIRP